MVQGMGLNYIMYLVKQLFKMKFPKLFVMIFNFFLEGLFKDHYSTSS
jgi:hypothetical protein